MAPEFGKRTSSPYAFSKPTPAREYASQTYLSPEIMTPQSDTKDKRRARFDSVSQPTSPRPDSVRGSSPRSKKGRDYFDTAISNDNAVDDDSDSSATRRAPRGSRRQQTKQQTDPDHSPSTSV